ncbi:MAG: rhodanese-like domain-containing protein [bacterium]
MKTSTIKLKVLITHLLLIGALLLALPLVAEEGDHKNEKDAEQASETMTDDANKPVGITAELSSITVKHKGEDVEIKRNPDNNAVVDDYFAKTSRPCPPFCIQPMKVDDAVDTIGEIEIIDYLKKRAEGDESILVIDSRTKTWVSRGTIPSAKNISWIALNPKKGATTEDIMNLMVKEFGVKLMDGADDIAVDEAIVAGDTSKVFDFKEAKTLVMFCNGMWCGQSPSNIKTLLKFGYPAEKLKWYRGGMQNWSNLGFTTAK